MRSILAQISRRLSASKPLPELNPRDSEAQDLVRRFDGLDEAKRGQLDSALDALWTAFTDRFDGRDGFLEAEAVRAAYIAKLSSAAERMSAQRDTPKGHYHQAVAMMAIYVAALDAPPSPQVLELSTRVADAIDRGRRARPPPDRSRVPGPIATMGKGDGL